MKEEEIMSLKKCPECGGSVSDKAVACPHCGAPLSTKVDDVEREEKSAVDNVHYDQNDHQIQPKNEPASTKPQMKKTGSKKRKRIFSLIILIVIIGAIIGYSRYEKEIEYYNTAINYYNTTTACGDNLYKLAEKYVDHWYDPGDSINNYTEGDGAALYSKMIKSYKKSQKIYATLSDYPEKYAKLHNQIQTTNKSLNALYSQITYFPTMSEDTFENRASSKFNTLDSDLKDLNTTLSSN